jgi:predicted metal-dependent phosphoesterase TrpH
VNAAGFCIHSAIHMAREDLMCVVHTHTAAGMAVAAQKQGLLPISQHALKFYGHLAYHGYEGIALDLDERERLVADLGQAFKRWLGKGAPGYAPASWPSLGTVTDALRAASGVAVLAHPLRYTLSAGQRRELCRQFAEAGGTAIEVCVGGQNPAQREVATGLCLRAGLEGSVGSDCHDPALPWQRPGRLAKLPSAITPVWRRWPATAVDRAVSSTIRDAASLQCPT